MNNASSAQPKTIYDYATRCRKLFNEVMKNEAIVDDLKTRNFDHFEKWARTHGVFAEDHDTRLDARIAAVEDAASWGRRIHVHLWNVEYNLGLGICCISASCAHHK